MNTKVNYSQFNKVIDDLTINLSCDHYIEMKPIVEVIGVEPTEIRIPKLAIKIHDKTLMHDIEAEATMENITEVIGILQSLVRQLKDGNVNTTTKGC